MTQNTIGKIESKNFVKRAYKWQHYAGLLED